MTPCELADYLGAHRLDITKELISLGKFISLGQKMDRETLSDLAQHVGLTVAGDAILSSLPSNVAPKYRWISFQANIRKRSLSRLFHFTPIRNLPGILSAGALLSRKGVKNLGIAAIRNNWGSYQKEQVLGSNYVCLSITNQWSMLRKLASRMDHWPAILVINPRVIWYEGTCFSPTNSASSTISARTLLKCTKMTHLDDLFSEPDTNWPSDLQAEVLVRDRIALIDVEEIVFYDLDAYEHAKEVCSIRNEDEWGVSVRITSRYYPDQIG
jgi:hypothetical protein